MNLEQVARRLIGRAREAARPPAPLAGYEPNPRGGRYVDHLDDEDLAELNSILRWNCFTTDSRGRRFGRAASVKKRNRPQPLPDPRIMALHERVDLSAKSVLEVGCFEGVHTSALCSYARQVTAVDSRVENVVKTIVRTAFLGHRPTVFKCDLEKASDAALLEPHDVIHHVGVFYHLKDPVTHLRQISRLARVGMLLDTHHAQDPAESYTVDGRAYRYQRYGEFGKRDVFSGMHDHSKWLRLEDIRTLLAEGGLGKIEMLSDRVEKNGPRFTLWAARG
jgi:2-polyprenyl-3-methyl-5-hydroxy-6-metoxy-1,4-benzoquinol methylase